MATNVANKKRAIVLLSGGMDSAVTTALASEKKLEMHGLALDYGQRHKKELRLARKLAGRYSFKSFRLVRLPMKELASGALVDGGRLRKTGVKAGRPSTYVSFRNGLMLAMATALADKLQATQIWGGWCLSDRGGYPDCRRDFLKAFQRCAALGTGSAGLKIVAPLANLSKQATILKGLKLGVNFKETWTCYAGGKSPCKKCDACRLRAKGFKLAGLKDPLER